MNPQIFASRLNDRNRELVERGLGAIQGMDASGLNATLEGGWSAAQLLEHMRISNEGYRETLEGCAAEPARDAEPKRTWFGKWLQKMSGPGGSAPMPKAFVPRAGPYEPSIVEDWKRSQEAVESWIGRLEGRYGHRFRNPFIRVFTMTVADALEVLVDHTERHVGQLEERVAKWKAGA